MGTPIDPAPPYGDNCNTCFPPGETPASVWASVTGIKPGDEYTGAESDCPNGIFKLNQIAACTWKTDPGFPAVRWRPVIGGSSVMDITVFDPGLAFYDIPAGNCKTRFVADWQSPVKRFHWGGVVQIMILADHMSLSIQSIANLVGIPIEPDTMMDFWPATEPDEIIALFARLRDSINILIKQDLTP